jgi:hypothetical protein
VLASLDSRRVTKDGLATTYRAAIPRPTDFSIFIEGWTGIGKTELTALYQQHYGPGMHAKQLPASWEWTANALEGFAFAKLRTAAQRVFRSKGNGAGRGRMNADATLKIELPSRALIMISGEDVPSGKSVRARLFVIPFARDSMNWKLLGKYQSNAREGLYATMAGFIQWMAGRVDQLDNQLRATFERYRAEAAKSKLHQRTPAIVAELALGWQLFLDFAREVEAISADEYERLWEEGWDALGRAAEEQKRYQDDADPVDRFFRLLGSAISSGAAHLILTTGRHPGTATLGWREQVRGDVTEWVPQGNKVGWIKAEASTSRSGFRHKHSGSE